MLNIAVLVSGGGTNLQALIDACSRGEIPNGKIACVISSRAGAYALERAKQAGIPAQTLPRKAYATGKEYDQALLALLREYKTDIIVLAGFMTIFGEAIVQAYPNRIINVHPALIPSFCGQGYYGLHVHEAALARGVKLTGATVHFVNEVCDGGPIILQTAVEVLPGDTPEKLQKRVMEQAEWIILPRAVALVCAGAVTVENGVAIVQEPNADKPAE